MNLLGAIAQAGVAGEAARAGGFQISRSLRFNSADSAYLSRTPASVGNRKTFTISFWIKRTSTGGTDLFRGTNANTNGFLSSFLPNGNLYLFDFGAGSSGFQIWSARVFRDFSSWYHIVIAVDTTQATDSNRIKVYVNGVQENIASWNVGSGASRYPTLNADFVWNTTTQHELGYAANYGFLNAYLTEFFNIDGQALTPSSFGETNATTGVWSPIAYAGSYGTNGFYLNFSDNSGVTATTLGKDQAGSNNWTPNNFSVTAGAGNDSLVDTPTPYGDDTGAGGEVRGNYCTMNPLDSVAGNLINGNLEYYDTSGNGEYAASTMSFDIVNEKYYIEYEVGTLNYNFDRVGIIPETNTGIYSGTYANSYAYYAVSGNKIPGNTAFGASINASDILGIAVGNGQIEYFKNGVSQGVLASGLTGRYKFASSGASNAHGVYNFGQRPFAYTAPSGFKALVTTNLPEPTVVQGDDYFNTVLYTGTGSSLGVTGVGFQPDWVWIKERNAAADHGLYDAVRGVTKQLESNTQSDETTEATGLTAFGTDGFTVGALAQLNTSADTYVAWNWKANGAGVSNTAGTIASTVSVSTTSGFSIVTYTGTGANATVGHGLGVAPKMIILKARTTGPTNWFVYHASVGNTAALFLNLTDASFASSTYWNDTSPTSSVFSLGTNAATNGGTLVAYCFADVEGFSKFGSFVGNGSSNGAFVYLGFRPAFVMLKDSSVGGVGSNWGMFDNDRLGYNSFQRDLRANVTNAEGNDNDLIDFLSNGFKIRTTSSGFGGGNGTTYIYMAFAENPVKFSLAR